MSFDFLYTLCVYRLCIYLLICVIKICHQHSYGFQNFMSSWGSSSKILKLQQVADFSFFRSKSSPFFFTTTREAFFAKKYQFFIFLCLLIFIEDFIKDFTNNSRCTLAYLFLPSRSSESPTPTSARSARVYYGDHVKLITFISWKKNIANYSEMDVISEVNWTSLTKHLITSKIPSIEPCIEI